jgi:hypothetical protein
MVFLTPPRRLPARTWAAHRSVRPTTLLGSLLAIAVLTFISPALSKEKTKDDKSKARDDKAAQEEKAEPEAKEKADAPEEEAALDEPVDNDTGASSESASASASASVGAGAPTGAAAAAVGPGNTIIFFEGGVRSDVGTLLQRETVGRLETETLTDVKALGPMFHVGLLTKIFWQFRLGVGFGYGFNYTLKERQTPTEREQELEQQTYAIGQLYTIDGRLEFSQILGDGFFVLVTPRGGLSMIGVGEDLKALANELEGSHVVRQGPRMGFLIGGDVGVRYMLRPWFSLRLTGGYSYTHQSLLKATRRGDAADSDRSWRMMMARFGTNLALEASF